MWDRGIHFCTNQRGSLSAENRSFFKETIMLQAGERSLKVILWWWLNSFCCCLLSSAEKRKWGLFPAFHSTTVRRLRGEDEKGKTSNCQQKKFDRIQSFFSLTIGKGIILISRMSTFPTLPKDCIWLLVIFALATLCSVRDIIVKVFSFWVGKPSFSRWRWVQAGRRSQIPSPINQPLPIQLTSAESSWMELAILTRGTI